MKTSSALLSRLSAFTFHGIATVVDRSFQLHDGGVHNAARAVVADRQSARIRADAAAAIRVSGATAQLSLIGA